jgi:hypothetical protein
MSSAVRDWAKAQGYDIGDRGRLPDWVVLAYEESKSEPQVESADGMDDQLWVQVNIPGQPVEVEEVACQLLLGILVAAGYGAQS